MFSIYTNFCRFLDIKKILTSLVNDTNVMTMNGDQFHLFYEELKCNNGTTLYADLHNSDWWKNTEDSIKPLMPNDKLCAVMPLILHIDDTILDATGKYTAKPISITIGNFSNSIRVSYCNALIF